MRRFQFLSNADHKDEPLVYPFEKGQKVRYKQDFLRQVSDTMRRRFDGRVGVVAGYRMGEADPIVDFARSGRYPALREVGLTASRLELVLDEGNTDLNKE